MSEEAWRIIRPTAADPEMHMALDEVITDRVASGEAPPTLRFWEWTQSSVVIGRFQSVRDEVNMSAADRHDVNVVRRSTGGGAMFTEPGDVITYSLSLPERHVDSDSITASYRELEDWSLTALNDLGVPAEHKPVNDIVYEHRKIGGSAQARWSGAVLHHTMMAYDMDIPKMLKVLRIGEEKLSDKAIESVEKRVGPIKTIQDVPRETVVNRMIDTFATDKSIHEGELTDGELKEARELAANKYDTLEWTERVDREIEAFDTGTAGTGSEQLVGGS